MPSVQFSALPIQTKRLKLRVPCQEDAAALFSIFSSTQAMRYWSTPPWTDTTQAEARIVADLAGITAGTALRLMLQPQSGTAPIGAVSIFGFTGLKGRAEVGYILAPAYWGMGFAKEAMTALIQYAFTALSVRRIEADIDPRNTSSCRLVERLGFRLEGTLRERWVVAGEVSDSAIYGLLQREWSQSAA